MAVHCVSRTEPQSKVKARTVPEAQFHVMLMYHTKATFLGA